MSAFSVGKGKMFGIIGPDVPGKGIPVPYSLLTAATR